MGNKIKVGMADLQIAKAPDILVTLGLGSCVGVALYDSKAKIGGLAHIMLPDSKQTRKGETNVAKFADTAIAKTLADMEKQGAKRQHITAKIAGGAQMFAFNNASEVMRVGDRNVEAVKKVLGMEKIPLIAEDTGGNFGRTIELDTSTGKLFVRTINKGEKEI